jgi:uncharacterized protein GlcG (DUF336 family)
MYTTAIENYFGTINLLRTLQITTHKAKSLQVPISASITDASGLSLAFIRMRDAKLVSIELAPKKAYTAVLFKMSTKDLGVATQPGSPFFQMETMLEGKIVTFGGGIPIFYDKQLIGAIGVSGGTPEQDHEIAKIAVDAFLKNKP